MQTALRRLELSHIALGAAKAQHASSPPGQRFTRGAAGRCDHTSTLVRITLTVTVTGKGTFLDSRHMPTRPARSIRAGTDFSSLCGRLPTALGPPTRQAARLAMPDTSMEQLLGANGPCSSQSGDAGTPFHTAE